ncbi:MAG: DMT family transporter [Oscillospiraceae bacterium]|nr:DMT family transporter [Clostridiaceae bacterium]MDD7614923.1 DMT family transporter [Clostridiaceae bacterium]MDY5890348.1 DMT family transporter [Oscillospiraceae bacterium]MDY5935084.1 DMT family transporter [Oscillospiraceae bacterium]
MVKINQKTKGIIYILTAAFGFSLMSLFVKLAGDLPAMQKAFFRNFVAMIFVFIMMLREKVGFIPPKEHIPDLLGRSFFGTLGLICNFYALGTLNLSDANMLNKLSPFFAIIFSVFLLREKPKLVQIIGVTVAFVGSLFIIKPGFENPQVLPAVAGLAGGMGAGIAYTFVRRLGKKQENSRRIIFFFSAFSCLLCLPFLIIQYKHMSLLQLVYLILAGTFACVGQLGITKAYICAPAREISVYDYTQVIFAAALGFLVFGDIPDLLSVVGYVLICGAGVAMFFYNKKRA